MIDNKEPPVLEPRPVQEEMDRPTHDSDDTSEPFDGSGFLQAQLQLQHDDPTLYPQSPKDVVTIVPVQQIPPEVLGEIFLDLPTPQLRPGNYQKHLTRLSLVCKDWCNAARLTPRLWCYIWVKVDAPGISFDSLSSWVSRGGSTPKTLEISASHCSRIDRSNGRLGCGGCRCLFSNISLAQLLKRAPGEWRSVMLNCPTPECLLRFSDSLQEVGNPLESSGWNYLQSFQLITSNWRGWIDRATQDVSWTAFAFIPNSITHLSLHLPSFPDDEDDVDPLLDSSKNEWNIQIPVNLLQGLTSLELRFDAPNVPASPLLATLQHCENLENLSIDFSDGVITEGPDGFHSLYHSRGGVPLLKLRRLSLSQVAGQSMAMLQLIKFPNLLDLFISFGAGGTMGEVNGWEAFSLHYLEHVAHSRRFNDGGALADFIYGDRASQSKLQRLHLKGASFLPGTLHRIIHRLYSLVYLKLEWISLIGDARNDFAKLAEDQQSPLPELGYLEVSRLKMPIGGEIPLLREFAAARGIDLKFSFHDRTSWERDDRQFLYLLGLESDSEDEW